LPGLAGCLRDVMNALFQMEAKRYLLVLAKG
jgi:hypothetical protein